MKNITKEQQIEAVSGWWNSQQIVKWDKQYDDWDSHTVRSLNRRLEKVLKYVDELELPKGAKVMELGYGAGQTALRIGQRGHEIHGIDISEKFCDIATQRCRRDDLDGNYYFTVGNLETRWSYEDNTFDLIVASGVLHYLYDDTTTIKEAWRVLKPGGHLLIAQRSAYGLNDFTSFRRFCRSMTYLLFGQKYELFPSFKSILCESTLGVIFARFENSKFFNSKSMLKGHDVWKYKLKKKLYTKRSLKALCRGNGFLPLRSVGAHYYVSEIPKRYPLNLKVDDFFENLSKKKLFGFVNSFARITVLLSQKTTDG
ncbi:MAG TPA: methyltransferase domain-containing protein [Candidatus Omnitrophota bacterium]|nr:methyltransferase domain-containing protein [Candidatus Omnitrophota bacterium]